MEKYIGCDAHRKYCVFVVVDEKGRTRAPLRCSTKKEEVRACLEQLPAGGEVGLEASGGWYWMVDEIERSGRRSRLVNPLETKKRMPGKMKTDQRDAGGIGILMRNGTLPEVWIPPAELRDLRGLLRTRLGLRQHQTAFKNRIHAGSGALRVAGRPRAGSVCAPSTAFAAELHRGAAAADPAAQLLKSLPGVGEILGATLALEIGDVERFADPDRLSSYAGLVPLVRSSGGKTWLGETSKRSNNYLRWAYVEAACCVVAQKKRLAGTYAVRLYEEKKAAKGHAKAAVAMGHHLAEASWWMLRKGEPYRERSTTPKVSSEIG